MANQIAAAEEELHVSEIGFHAEDSDREVVFVIDLYLRRGRFCFNYTSITPPADPLSHNNRQPNSRSRFGYTIKGGVAPKEPRELQSFVGTLPKSSGLVPSGSSFDNASMTS